ncbi:MAG: Ammonium transporter [Pseudomonas helleri]|jgi:ammonium transporter, Amt family|uniref:Ammonium transporter n=1 Tax=Pseudomonas helleri TaxID=1608996 RepID=A0A6I1WX84_9PSED|nr:ammonium transporter [Pseudomonas helleri]MQT38957.1 ammonium transporter [Pseudomonas helleri]MQU24321.1 ammonium transporter [Pseudomonas helleri]MQU45676.1 ammonium transporter [Pseudomonas helleri]
MKRIRLYTGLAGMGWALLSATANAATQASGIDTGDTAFIICCALLVVLMTVPGLALFYGGLARSKNILSILMQVFCIASMISILFTMYGYSLIFADGGSWQSVIGSFDKAFLRGVGVDAVHGTIPELLYFFFMLLFAAITPAMIIGSFAERVKFSAVMVFMALWMTINYIPMAHMAWVPGGWIYELGAQDFAGGNVVHVNVGIAALIGAFLLGRRRGFGTAAMMPHNMTMTMTGGSMLWVGWLGFCGGCVWAANGYSVLIIINTMLASCAGALSWSFFEWRVRGKPSMLGAVSGSIAGLVAITPAGGYAGPMGAIMLGALVAPVCIFAIEKIKPFMGVDDAFDVFGVHGVGGIFGGLMTPVFALPVLGGMGYVDSHGLLSQWIVNLEVVAFSIVFSAVSSLIAYKITALVCRGLRVDEEHEMVGLDVASHGEVGYKLTN